MDEKTLNGLYNMLTSQHFYDWYNNEMEDHITGEEGCLEIAPIKEQIAQMVHQFSY